MQEQSEIEFLDTFIDYDCIGGEDGCGPGPSRRPATGGVLSHRRRHRQPAATSSQTNISTLPILTDKGEEGHFVSLE